MASAATTSQLRDLVAQLGASGNAAPFDDAERIDRIRLLEELKSVASAVQADEMVRFAASQRSEQANAGVPSERRDRGIAAQLGLAMRTSPWSAARRLGFARVLCGELPETYAALKSGKTTEWRAMLVARESAPLERELRAVLDARLGPELENMGDRRVEAEARQLAYRLDPAAALARRTRAEADRRVGIRPAPDTMCYLTALLPVEQGVAAYATLKRAADCTTAAGDERGRGQIMADTLVERVTGQAKAEAVPVEVNVLIPADTLVGTPGEPGADEPGWLDDYGPIPADVARNLAYGDRDDDDVAGRRWMRRMFTAPGTGELVSMERNRYPFSTAQRAFLRRRDRFCRTLWCGAPIRHADHVKGRVDGGPTAITNGQGLCEACNYAKQAPGWAARARPDGAILTRTPTGHRYVSRAPAPPGSVRTTAESKLERRLRAYLRVA